MSRPTLTSTAPPAFLGLAGHPIRWRLLSELARSDLLVDELVARVAQPQALVSYHLGRLRSGELVSARRSAKDGRSVYYRARLDRYETGLAAVGPSLYAGLDLVPRVSPATLHPRRGRPPAVLFVCTGNSARSQMAEALLHHSVGGSVRVASAGSAPKPVHRYAVEVMAVRGIDISSWTSKPLTDFARQRFDYVVTLCDKVRERCPEFVNGDEQVHWSIEDPTASPDGRPVGIARFERLAAELDDRIGWFVRSIEGPRINDKAINGKQGVQT